MKAYLRVIAILLLTAMFAACELDVLVLPTDSPLDDSDVAEAETALAPTEKTDSASGEADSLLAGFIDSEYRRHKKKEIQCVQDIKDFSESTFYTKPAYEANYDRLVNRIYRALLDLQLLRYLSINVSKYRELEESMKSFMEGKTPTLLYSHVHPADGAELPLHNGFLDPLDDLLLSDKERFIKDEELVTLFMAVRRFYHLEGMGFAEDYTERYAEVPELLERLVPKDVEVVGQSLDTDKYLTAVEVNIPDGCIALATVGEELNAYEPYGYGTYGYNTILLNPGDKLLLPPLYSGYVYFAAVNGEGFAGNTVKYLVESNRERLPVKEVAFKSKFLDAAVRKYLGKGSEDIITTIDLLAVEHVVVGGDVVTLEIKERTREMQSSEELAKENDFCFEDLDYFFGLDYLCMYNFPIHTLPDGRYKHIDTLSLTRCPTEDISVLADSTIRTLSIEKCGIRDASAIGGMNYLEGLWMPRCHELEKISLPSKSFLYIVVDSKILPDIHFLDNISGTSSLNIGVTDTMELKSLVRFQGMKTLRLYNQLVIDLEFTKNMSGLKLVENGPNRIVLE